MQYCKGFHGKERMKFVNKKNEILFIRIRPLFSLLWNEKTGDFMATLPVGNKKNFHCFDT